MASQRPHRIILTGFSGSGKSQVARLVAGRLGPAWRAIDTDDLIEALAGRTIPDIFADDGEPRFRELESAALRRACVERRVVIASGGGAILSAENRRLMADGGFVVCLEARPETILRRLSESGDAPSERPLLAGDDPLARIRELKAQRQPLYALADCTIHTAGLTPDAVAAEVVRAWRLHSATAVAAGSDRLLGPVPVGPLTSPERMVRQAHHERSDIPPETAHPEPVEGPVEGPVLSLSKERGSWFDKLTTSGIALSDRYFHGTLPSPLASAPAFADAACVVRGEGFAYPVFVAWGSLDDPSARSGQGLGRRLRQVGLGGRAHVVTDDRVGPLWGGRAVASLAEAGYDPALFAIPAGEASKTLTVAATVYDWLVARRAEFADVVVALGGGVVGDLAGFVAATYLRGLNLAQVPTSLLAMVDAAIGGKTAVDHPQAKNLIGAFYQPRLVLADVAVLGSLPPRELTSGWAEAIKHALIRDADLLRTLEERAEAVTSLDPAIAAQGVARSIAIKGEVVSQDPTETGLRTILNYGHTIGHALEAASAYGRLLHGEAVAIGMMGAAEIGQRLGMTPPSLVERQRQLLRRFGLPLRAAGIDRQRVQAAMALDKKVRGSANRWVLLEDVGRTAVRDDVPTALVAEVVRGLLA